jgi:hypothetical protein
MLYTIKVHLIKAIMIGLPLIFLTACGSVVNGWVGGECYGCVDTPCDCTGNGYNGFYNPKALNLYRPGRFEDLESHGL